MPLRLDELPERSSFYGSHFSRLSKIHLQLLSKNNLSFFFLLFLRNHSYVLLIFGKRCNFLRFLLILSLLNNLTNNIVSISAFLFLILLEFFFLKSRLKMLSSILELTVNPIEQLFFNLFFFQNLRHELSLKDVSSHTHILSNHFLLPLHFIRVIIAI